MSNGSLPRWPSVEPHATIGAQDLVQGQPDRCGFLRKRGQKERVLENLHLSRHINWRQRFVVIKDGCCYCYADEVSKAPLQTFSLQGYNKIYRSRSERAAFVFALESDGDYARKVHTFAATTDDDRIAWMQTFRDAMAKANDVAPTPARSSLSDQEDMYVELEKPVYTATRIPRRSVADVEESPEEEEEESDDDSDYDRPDEDLLNAVREKTQRRNLPLPPVPQDKGDQDSPTSPPPVSRRPETLSTRLKPPPPGGSGEGHTASRSKPPDPRHRPAVPLPTSPRETSAPDVMPKPKALLPPSHSASGPATPKKPVTRLSEKDCFFDNNDREAAIEILRESNTPGTFLIRKSRQGDSKVLVVMTTEDVKEYKIFSENNVFSLDKKTFFNSVDELLNNYHKAPLPNRQQTLNRSYSSASRTH